MFSIIWRYSSVYWSLKILTLIWRIWFHVPASIVINPLRCLAVKAGLLTTRYTIRLPLWDRRTKVRTLIRQSGGRWYCNCGVWNKRVDFIMTNTQSIIYSSCVNVINVVKSDTDAVINIEMVTYDPSAPTGIWQANCLQTFSQIQLITQGHITQWPN